jgi:hypothetical protein
MAEHMAELTKAELELVAGGNSYFRAPSIRVGPVLSFNGNGNGNENTVLIGNANGVGNELG